MRRLLAVLTLLLIAVLMLARFAPEVAERVLPDHALKVRPGEIRLEGRIGEVKPDKGLCVLKVTAFGLSNGNTGKVSPARSKVILVSRSTALHIRGSRTPVAISSLQPGVEGIVVGRDLGSGRRLPAREFAVWDGESGGTYSLSPAPVVLEQKRTVVVNRHKYSAKVVWARLDSVRMKVGLGGGYVGFTDSLAAIAKRHHAVAAINGSCFDAYASGSIKVPYMSFVTDGQLVYQSRIGTMIGFTEDNKVGMDMAAKVVYFYGNNPGRGFGARWNRGVWLQVREAVGAGPRLLTDGKLSVFPEYEGFSHPKILYLSCQRSAVGVTRDNKWLLMVTTQGTMRQLAEILWRLGAYQTMAMDGGASSGLWLLDHYVTTPGRKISNALLVLNR